MASGFRFRKKIKLLPGVDLNISKTGFSFSIGPDKAHITTGTHGTTLYFNLPGSGAYYQKKIGGKNKDTENGDKAEDALKVGFTDRLTTPPPELSLLDALRELNDGNTEKAFEHARQEPRNADGAFLAGYLALRLGHYQDAIEYLNEALRKREELGKTFEKYKLEFAVGLPITEEINVQLTPTENSILIALAETYRQMEMPEAAIEVLMDLHQRDPEDLIVRLSLAELLDERYPDAQQAQQQIVQLAEGVHNESPIHAALMYYRGMALRKLGLLEGALDTFNKALRRHKDYPDDLLTALRYERALVYEATGEAKKAREEFEKVYAVAPSFGEVAAKLGL